MVSRDERRVRGELQKLSRHAGKRKRKQLLQELGEKQHGSQANRYGSWGYNRPLEITTPRELAEERIRMHEKQMARSMRSDSQLSCNSYITFGGIAIRILSTRIHDTPMVPSKETAEDPLRLPDPDDKD